MKVAAIQMVSCTRVADNLRAAHALLAEAAQGGAELAVLPEYFCVMGQRDTDKLALRTRCSSRGSHDSGSVPPTIHSPSSRAVAASQS